MMDNLKAVLDKLDWQQLKLQKDWLREAAACARDRADAHDEAMITGLIGFVQSVQNAATADGFRSPAAKR